MVKDLTKFKTLLKLSGDEAMACWDKLSSFCFNKFSINLFALDDILHARHGKYETEDKSMQDVIAEFYGKEASLFVKNHI